MFCSGSMRFMNNAVLIIGGTAPSYESITNDIASSYICAADSGFDTCLAWNVIPNLVLGDMDSVMHSDKLSICNEILRFPRNKDYTDTELGINILYERGYNHITIIGGGGGRIDHLFALLYLFFRISNAPFQWITNNERIILVKRSITCRLPHHSLVSVFPGPRGASSMTSTGLQWPLTNVQFAPGFFGISNIAIDDSISITTNDESLIAILPLEAVLLEYKA